MSFVTEITDDTFADEVLASDKPTLVDYWADWCSPCKQLAPILEEIAAEHSDKVKFCKLDTNANPNAAMSQGVMSLPTLQLFVNGQVVNQLTGGKTKAAILKALDEYL